MPRERMETLIEENMAGRFSKATLKSTAQNINSTWTQSGHLTGRAIKLRAKPTASMASVTFALFLGYLEGARGKALFETEYMELLQISFATAIALAEEASQRGWIVCKRIGEIIEVLFPLFLVNPDEGDKL